MDASALNFSWVIDRELAGCAGPVLGRDLEFLATRGIQALVRLAGPDEGVFDGQTIRAAGIEDFVEPVPDYMAPSIQQIERVVLFIRQSLAQRRPAAVSCGAGRGRTGTILSCYFVHLGLTADEAINKIHDLGRCAFEAPNQRDAIRQFEQRKRGSSAEHTR